jgi:predicted nucleic acid-binding protein
MKYCLDSCVFIEAWNKHYSPEISMDFWDWLANLAKNKEIFIPEEVYEEIVVQKDKLYEWVKSIKTDIVYQLDYETQQAVNNIMTKPEAIKLADSNTKNGADVFVVAYAKRNNATVVSNDKSIGNLCKVCDVKILKDYEFLKAKKLRMKVSLE